MMLIAREAQHAGMSSQGGLVTGFCISRVPLITTQSTHHLAAPWHKQPGWGRCRLGKAAQAAKNVQAGSRVLTTQPRTARHAAAISKLCSSLLLHSALAHRHKAAEPGQCRPLLP